MKNRIEAEIIREKLDHWPLDGAFGQRSVFEFWGVVFTLSGVT